MLALPSTLQYSTKSTSAFARSFVSNVQPSGSLDGYTPGSTVTFNIPTSPNSVLCGAESVLKFNLKPTSTTGSARLDSCGAHAVIKRIRIYHGTNLLEDIDNYSLFAKEMYDLQVSNDSVSGKYSILSGTRPDLYGVPVDTTNTISRSMNTGALLSLSGNDYCITLISLLGSLSGSKYLPLFACTSSPIRLEITFVSSIYNMCCANTLSDPGFTVNRIEFLGSFMELSDSAMTGILSSASGEVFSYNTVGVRNFQDSMALPSSGTTQKNMVIPARFSSIKSVIVSLRDSAKIGIAGFYPLGTYKYNLEEYNFKIGTSLIPAKAPSTVPNFFYELLKCVNSVSNVDHQPSIDLASYNINSSGTAVAEAVITSGNGQSGSFYIGLNCENFPNSDTTNFYSGLNTTNDDVICMLKCTGIGADLSMRLDAFVTIDQELRFENGVAYLTF